MRLPSRHTVLRAAYGVALAAALPLAYASARLQDMYAGSAAVSDLFSYAAHQAPCVEKPVVGPHGERMIELDYGGLLTEVIGVRDSFQREAGAGYLQQWRAYVGSSFDPVVAQTDIPFPVSLDAFSYDARASPALRDAAALREGIAARIGKAEGCEDMLRRLDREQPYRHLGQRVARR